MQLPTKLRIGKRNYVIKTYKTYHNTKGATYPSLGVVHVATHQNARPRSKRAISETFWHEITHAILHDMQHPLWDNEVFVTQFSKRLSQAINTAKLP